MSLADIEPMDPLTKLMLLEDALSMRDPEELTRLRGALDGDAGYFSADETIYTSWVEGPDGEHFIDVLEDLLGSLAVEAALNGPDIGPIVPPGNLLRPSVLAAS